MTSPAEGTVSRIESLVVLPNWVGDTVMALPVLAALHDADRNVTALVRAHLEPLVASQAGVADTLVRGSEDKITIASLAEGRFAEAVVLPNSFRSAWWPFRAGIPRRWGYRSPSPEGLLRAWLLKPSLKTSRAQRQQHQVQDYGPLLAAMGVAAPDRWIPRLALPRAASEAGEELLVRTRIDRGREPLVGLFPGGEYGPSKRWPWQRFAETARKLRRSLPASQQIILAGPKEVWLAVRVHEESGKIHPVVGPDLDLVELASVIARLDLLITNDSGPMHMAAALGVPCLALFGPTNPDRTRPVGDAHEVLYRERWCSPCFRRRCPLLHHRCMRDLSVDDVTQRALSMLSSAAV